MFKLSNNTIDIYEKAGRTDSFLNTIYIYIQYSPRRALNAIFAK